MRNFILFLLSTLFLANAHAQNVGIGTEYPNNGKLVIKQPTSNTVVVVGDSTTGLSLGGSNAPVIGFNNFVLDGSRRRMAAGYSSYLYFNPVSGNFFYNSSDETGAQGSPVSLTNRFSVTSNGNFGIGTSLPTYKLDVNGRVRIRHNGGTSGLWLNKEDNSETAAFIGNFNDSTFGVYGTSWRFFFNHRNGNLGIGVSNPRVDLSFPAATGKKISLYPGQTGDVGVGVYGNELRLHSDHSNADITFGFDNFTNGFTERMRVKGDGRICIGTTTPAAGYLLSVKGKIISEEVRVQLKASWPDYVFKKDYTLMNLNDLEKYVNENNHLPGFDKAAVIEKEGADVGETQRKLVEKVEELTLHLISLNKRMELLEKENALLKKSKHK